MFVYVCSHKLLQVDNLRQPALKWLFGNLQILFCHPAQVCCHKLPFPHLPRFATSFGQGLIGNFYLLRPKPICFTVHRDSKEDTISERIKLLLLWRKYTLLFPGHLLEHSFLIILILQFKIRK